MACPRRWWPSSLISPPGAETLALSMGPIADNPSFRIRARELQQLLGGEDGVANVVAAIEAQLIKNGSKEPGSPDV
jgi:hypothetical protein